jgi:hypothetical protein
LGRTTQIGRQGGHCSLLGGRSCTRPHHFLVFWGARHGDATRSWPLPLLLSCFPQLLILGEQGSTHAELARAIKLFINTPIRARSLLHLISSNPALSLKQYAIKQAVPPGGRLCFKVRAAAL